MKAWPSLLAIVVGSASPAGAQAPAAARATPDDVLAGVEACMAALSTAGFDASRLAAAGWTLDPVSADTAPPVARLFVNPVRPAPILVSGEVGRELCFSLAGADPAAGEQPFILRLVERFGMPQPESERTLTFQTALHRATLENRGTATSPTISVGVSAVRAGE